MVGGHTPERLHQKVLQEALPASCRTPEWLSPTPESNAFARAGLMEKTHEQLSNTDAKGRKRPSFWKTMSASAMAMKGAAEKMAGGKKNVEKEVTELSKQIPFTDLMTHASTLFDPDTAKAIRAELKWLSRPKNFLGYSHKLGRPVVKAGFLRPRLETFEKLARDFAKDGQYPAQVEYLNFISRQVIARYLSKDIASLAIFATHEAKLGRAWFSDVGPMAFATVASGFFIPSAISDIVESRKNKKLQISWPTIMYPALAALALGKFSSETFNTKWLELGVPRDPESGAYAMMQKIGGNKKLYSRLAKKRGKDKLTLNQYREEILKGADSSKRFTGVLADMPDKKFRNLVDTVAAAWKKPAERRKLHHYYNRPLTTP